MVRIVGVGDLATVEALRLMGISGTVAEDAGAALRALEEAMEPEAVILVSESVAGMMRERIEELKEARTDFMVIELPAVGSKPTQAEETARLVSQAIGMKI